MLKKVDSYMSKGVGWVFINTYVRSSSVIIPGVAVS